MSLPIVYHADYVTPLPDGHRFPMRKFKELYEYLRKEWADHVREYDCELVSDETLTRVHDPDYVERFENGNLSDRAVRRIGLPWSPGLVKRTKTAVGGTIRTVQLALQQGLACNVAGGTHHAKSDEGGGFCIFNDVAVSAQYALDHTAVDQVLIVDADVHQGNGTAEIFQDVSRVRTVSIHCGDNYPFSPVSGNHDVPLDRQTGDEGYLEPFARLIDQVFNRSEPDLLIYDAGVDVHRDDRLGRVNLTDDGIRRRDRHVLSEARRREIPTAGVIGGGYDRDISALARRHALLHESAMEVREPERAGKTVPK